MPLVERIEHDEFDADADAEFELLLPYDEGGRLAELHELAGDLVREDTPGGVRGQRPAAGRRWPRVTRGTPPAAAPGS